jgi:large subunit ribosomal protein L7/L12
VVLLDVGPNPIQMIREVRAVTGLDLRQTRELVESVPKTILSAVPKKMADELCEKLTAAGGKAEVQPTS